MKLRVGSLEAKAFILHGGELEKAIQELLGLGYLQVMTQDRNGAWLLECLERIEEELKRLTPRKKGPMHSCDDPLCAVCGNPYA